MVHKAAARLLNGTKKRQHITPILAKLHWLPVKNKVKFKILLFVFKAFNGLASKYISDQLNSFSTPRSLRSSLHLLL